RANADEKRANRSRNSRFGESIRRPGLSSGRTITMKFDRRSLLKAGAALPLAATLPRFASAGGAFAPNPGAWRRFESVTGLTIAKPDGKAQAWVPVPAVNEAEWFKSVSNTWTTNGNAELLRDSKNGAEFVRVEWKDGETTPAIKVTSRVAMRDRAADLSKP